jgi:glycosyltransferase involved in cell wall biosynthesis
MATRTVSIVIPAYNHADFLEEAIESVLAQDYPDVELIVLDDGSTDGTRSLLQKYSGRLYWETQSNMGQSATLNKGWGMAKGEILSKLSADDLLLPGCIRAAVETLEAFPSAVVTYCDFELIDPKSQFIRTVHAQDLSYREMVVNFECAPGPGAFIRQSAFASAGGWDLSLRQMPDYEHWLRLGLLGEFRRIPRTLAAFRVHENSLTFAPTQEQSAEEPVRILEKYFGLEGVPAAIRREQPKAMSNAYLTSAQLHLRSGRYAEAFGHVRRAAALCPGSLFQLRLLRRIANALFNRMGHRLIWRLRRIGGARV